jgi:membrane protein
MMKSAAIDLIKTTFSDWIEDKAPRLGAALAYYAVFSIPPLIVIVIAAIGFFYRGDVAGAIETQIASLVGNDAARTMLETAQHHGQNRGTLAAIFGIGLLLFGASGVFAELQDALNTIWEVQSTKKGGILSIIKARFVSFTMVLGMAFLLLVSLILTAAVSAFGGMLNAWLPFGEPLAKVMDFAISFGVVTLLFAMIFKILPDVKLAWSDVWIGAAATSALFTIGKFLIGLYLGGGTVGSDYGAAASVIIMIVWVYYSAQILFLGAEFTQVYANRYGSRVVPAEGAEQVTPERRAQQGLQPMDVPVGKYSASPSTDGSPTSGNGFVALAALCVGFLVGRKFRLNQQSAAADLDDSSRVA